MSCVSSPMSVSTPVKSLRQAHSIHGIVLPALAERCAMGQLQGAALSGVAATADDSLADASLSDVRAPQKTLSQVCCRGGRRTV